MAKWECKSCGKTAGVTNGECEKCGPTQTVPMDKEAMKEAGVKISKPQEEAIEGVEPSIDE